jgi:hypothetical protein
LGGSQLYLPSINWIPSRIAMAFGESEERATNQEALDGILPVPGHIEVPPNPHRQPHPSRLSEDGTQDSGEGGNEIEENQEDENRAETENQHDEIEADGRNQGTRNDTETVSQQDVQAVKTDIASMPEFGEVIGFGDRIPNNSIFPLLFSQSYLEWFEPYKVKRKIEAISAYSKAASQLHGLVKLHIFDLQVSVDMGMNERPIKICKSSRSINGQTNN